MSAFILNPYEHENADRRGRFHLHCRRACWAWGSDGEPQISMLRHQQQRFPTWRWRSCRLLPPVVAMGANFKNAEYSEYGGSRGADWRCALAPFLQRLPAARRSQFGRSNATAWRRGWPRFNQRGQHCCMRLQSADAARAAPHRAPHLGPDLYSQANLR